MHYTRTTRRLPIALRAFITLYTAAASFDYRMDADTGDDVRQLAELISAGVLPRIRRRLARAFVCSAAI